MRDTGSISRASWVTAVAAAGVLLVLLVAQPAPPTMTEPGAVGTVGIVLGEAIVLYVVYGAITSVVSPTVRGFLVSE